MQSVWNALGNIRIFPLFKCGSIAMQFDVELFCLRDSLAERLECAT